MGLTREDVDLHQGRATLHETKNGERRVVPLTGKVLELLKENAKVRRLEILQQGITRFAMKSVKSRSPPMAAEMLASNTIASKIPMLIRRLKYPPKTETSLF